MARSQNKTQPTAASVETFLSTVEPPQKQTDARTLLIMMQDLTGKAPVMWGSSIIGFGTYQYKYDSGREGSHIVTGFSPRKTALTVYIMCGFDSHQGLMDRLGTYKTGRSCLYIKKLSDIDQDILRQLIMASITWMKANYPTDL